MKTTTLIDRYKKKTQNQSHTQRLITEFTPSTGLRLRVPLQMEPIQLKASKMVQMVLDSANQFQHYGQKSPRPLLWNITNWLSKAKKSQIKQRRQSTLFNHSNWSLIVKSSRLLSVELQYGLHQIKTQNVTENIVDPNTNSNMKTTAELSKLLITEKALPCHPSKTPLIVHYPSLPLQRIQNIQINATVHIP